MANLMNLDNQKIEENYTRIEDFDEFPKEVRLKWLLKGLKEATRMLQKKKKKMTKSEANKILGEKSPEELQELQKKLMGKEKKS